MAPSCQQPWSKSTDTVLKELQVDPSAGVCDDLEARRAHYGFNELEKQPGTSVWKLILEQFNDTLVKVLLLSAGVSFLLAFFDENSQHEGLRAYVEPFVILLILFLNAAVGVWQESRSEAALEALKELQGEHAKVIREGKMISDLPARELVPGDIVELHVGDRVPADLRILQLRTATVRAEQASLTGESVSVLKGTEPVPKAECELQAKENMLFAGTAISNGICVGCVASIGMDTEIGKIQSQIQEASEENDDTPLKKKLDEFGEMLAKVIFYICVAVWLINYKSFLSFQPLVPGIPFLPNPATIQFDLSKAVYYLKIAVALAVAAIPEGLPAVITTCLALGTRTMAKKNAIVRKLPSVETLGCTSVICSDKTGTLTTNQMSTVQVTAVDEGNKVRTWHVTGHTYNPADGHVQGLTGLDKALQAVCEVCAVCNESKIEFKGSSYKAVGAPTEAALLTMVEKMGAPDGSKQVVNSQRKDPANHPQPVCDTYKAKMSVQSLLEFDRDRKSMSVLASPLGNGTNTLLVKGAAECILDRSTKAMLPNGSIVPLNATLRKAILKTVEEMAESALRCLALAQKTELGPLSNYNGDPKHPGHKVLQDPANYEGVESELTFLGLVGLQDPPRPEVKGAITECRQAGIRVMVITGDNKKTAEAICQKIGVITASDVESSSFTGSEFVSLPRSKQISILKESRGCVFSRAEPRHKQDIVRLLKELGEITAMTGDGVNDAPALKLADIGVAMGISGTEVAKEASDMVLADDNFSTIVSAVSEGRAIYSNMKAFIRYMISSNIGEVASIFLTAALGLPEGLIPVQLLWVNLVTDGPPATALGFNKPDLGIMNKPPRKSDEMLISTWVFFRYMVVGMYVGFATVGVFCSWFMYDKFMGIDLSKDGHTPVTFNQLTHWQSCSEWEEFKASGYSTANGGRITFDNPCDYFTTGKTKAMTLSLSVLVAIEMFNALNALSEDYSLLQMPPWSNPYLLVAIALSFSLHFVILYVPFLADIFNITPLSIEEWQLVLLWSLPVILLDEVLKLFARLFFGVRDVKPKMD
mmetsp:Transcript_25245/g.68622  ORF Transcript_25245/g.68622 Transcript_25245/m.68622 type:complete len:1048 (+) Transcript_25245:127-3270(+)|eukprot:CAMPEP_0202345486 /NCGR_PEP_ID=MMETSP1126-20121109/4705_1 /ASSEMBLY_ACC=CAM_ASM_000457 /TAXON_ID=3047 /ORGANISM="Dunaliella tertiolecta, Strain CCMP1320" /LENGTH=1047 /DNA_ID=CAMNT_0048936799 /DNA_START=120 /DNA_END=3263 /DNA_ORIENTATION=-